MLFSTLALIQLFPLSTSILKADDCWLGEPYAFSQAECRITLHNADSKPLHLELRTSRGATIEPEKLDVPANGSAQALIRVDVGNTAGRLERIVRIRSDRAADSTAWARGFAVNVLDDPRPVAEFGAVDVSKSTEIVVAVDSHDVAKFRIEKVLSRPAGIDVAIEPSERAIRVRLAKDAPLGIIDGDIKLAIDTPHQREAWVHVNADVRGEVTIESNPYWFGSVDAAHGALVPLTTTTPAPFRIGAVQLGLAKGKTEIVPCDPVAPNCKAIRVIFDASQRAGTTRATLDIDLPDQQRKMNVRIWGVLVDPTAAPGDSAPLPAPPQEDLSAPWTEGIVDSINAPVYAVPTEDPYNVADGPPPPTEPPPGSGPLLKWQTASEGDVYGYQVFRGESESGPFLLQNERFLRTHAKQYAATPYFWRDDHATKGTAYWYYVGVVYKDGHKQVLSAPHRKVAD